MFAMHSLRSGEHASIIAGMPSVLFREQLEPLDALWESCRLAVID